jgi:hypothetical protein
MKRLVFLALMTSPLVLFTPYNVRAEATHTGTFDIGVGGQLAAIANRAGMPQSVFITACVEPSLPSPSIEVRVTSASVEHVHLLAIGAGACEGASVTLADRSQVEIIGVEGIAKGQYTVSVDLRQR